VTNGNGTVEQLTQRRRELRKKTNEARQSLRKAEHARDRARNVVRRFKELTRVLWTFLTLGSTGLLAGLVAVYVDTVLPLDLGGPILACFLVGSPVFAAAAITLGVVHYLDHDYARPKSRNSYGETVNEQMTRAEFADHLAFIAEDRLDDLTQLTVELQEVEEELRLAGDAT
jgi:hypothetical protein